MRTEQVARWTTESGPLPSIRRASFIPLLPTAMVRDKVKFQRENLQGPPSAGILVRLALSHPFTTLGGGPAVPEAIGDQEYDVGLLPACVKTEPQWFGACLRQSSKPVAGWQWVVERVRFLADDPKQR